MPHERRRKTRRGKKQKSTTENPEEKIVNEQENITEESVENVQEEITEEQTEEYSEEKAKKALFDANNWNNEVQAHYGRPTTDILQYFSNIEKMMTDQEFETEEEQDMFLNNIYKEIDGNELQLATDKDCSRILERILRISNDGQIRVFLNQLNEKYIELFTHRYGSHVCQTILVLGADIIEREIKGESIVLTTDEQEPPPSMETLLINMCNVLKEYWIHLISNQFGSHLLRVLLMILSGQYVTLESNEVRSKKSKKYNANHNNNMKTFDQNKNKKRLVPESFKEILNDILDNLTKDMGVTELRVFSVNSIANPVLQFIVQIQSNNGNESLINNLFNVSENGKIEKDSFVNDLLKHPVGSHLFEKVLKYSTEKTFHQIFITYFHGNLVELCRNAISNFVVQHLLENARSAQQFLIMIKEIISEFEYFLFRGRSGVVVKSLESCGKFKIYQKEAVNAVMKAFHVTTPETRKLILKLLLTLKKYEDYEREPNSPYLIQGALMVETLLSYEDGNNKFLIESLLSVPENEIKEWTSDPIASRVIESFLLSQQVILKAKRKILHMFDGNYAAIACNRYGSHLVDKCWAVSDLKMKESIAEELLEGERELNSNFHGKFVLRNCKIENFKRNRKEWIEHEHGLERKKQMFQEFLGDDTIIVNSSTNAKNTENTNNSNSITSKKSKVLDSAMSILGFEKGLANNTYTTSKKKSKKSKKKSDTNMIMEDDNNDDDVRAKEEIVKTDEIDQLFRKKNSIAKKASVKVEKTNTTEVEEEKEESKENEDKKDKKEKRKDKKKAKKESKDLNMVLEAITSAKTKRKHSSKKNKDDDEDKKSKKRKTEKRKFES